MGEGVVAGRRMVWETRRDGNRSWRLRQRVTRLLSNQVSDNFLAAANHFGGSVKERRHVEECRHLRLSPELGRVRLDRREKADVIHFAGQSHLVL